LSARPQTTTAGWTEPSFAIIDEDGEAQEGAERRRPLPQTSHNLLLGLHLRMNHHGRSKETEGKVRVVDI